MADLLSDSDIQKLSGLFGSGLMHIMQTQPTFHGFPILDPAKVPAPTAQTERRTPIVPEVSGLRMEDWLASIDKASKAAAENLDLAAEEMVRLAAAGKVTADTWDQQRKALEYLNGRSKEKAELDKKMSKDAVTLSAAFQGVQRSLVTTTATLAGVGAELRHFAGAANPGLLRAWDGSLQLLQTRIGGALLPAIDATIDTIMDVADWFETLSDTEKKLVAGAIVATPAVIGLTHAAIALAPAGRLAWTTLQAVATRFNAMSMAGKLAVGGIGAISTGLLALLDVASEAKSAQERRKQSIERSGRVQEQEFSDLAHFGTMGAAERRRLVEGDSRAEDIARMRQTAQRLRDKWNDPGFMDRVGENLGFQTREQDEQRARMMENLADRLERFPRVETIAEQDWRRQVRHASMRVSAQQENKPAYSPLEEARKQLQLQILGKDRYQQEILREQRKHRQEEINRLDQLIRQGRQQGFRFSE